MNRYRYHFKHMDGSLVRWCYPNGSLRVEGGRQAARNAAQIEANQTGQPIRIMRSHWHESFDQALSTGEVVPS